MAASAAWRFFACTLCILFSFTHSSTTKQYGYGKISAASAPATIPATVSAEAFVPDTATAEASVPDTAAAEAFVPSGPDPLDIISQQLRQMADTQSKLIDQMASLQKDLLQSKPAGPSSFAAAAGNGLSTTPTPVQSVAAPTRQLPVRPPPRIISSTPAPSLDSSSPAAAASSSASTVSAIDAAVQTASAAISDAFSPAQLSSSSNSPYTEFPPLPPPRRNLPPETVGGAFPAPSARQASIRAPPPARPGTDFTLPANPSAAVVPDPVSDPPPMALPIRPQSQYYSQPSAPSSYQSFIQPSGTRGTPSYQQAGVAAPPPQQQQLSRVLTPARGVGAGAGAGTTVVPPQRAASPAPPLYSSSSSSYPSPAAPSAASYDSRFPALIPLPPTARLAPQGAPLDPNGTPSASTSYASLLQAPGSALPPSPTGPVRQPPHIVSMPQPGGSGPSGQTQWTPPSSDDFETMRQSLVLNDKDLDQETPQELAQDFHDLDVAEAQLNTARQFVKHSIEHSTGEPAEELQKNLHNVDAVLEQLRAARSLIQAHQSKTPKENSLVKAEVVEGMRAPGVPSLAAFAKGIDANPKSATAFTDALDSIEAANPLPTPDQIMNQGVSGADTSLPVNARTYDSAALL